MAASTISKNPCVFLPAHHAKPKPPSLCWLKPPLRRVHIGNLRHHDARCGLKTHGDTETGVFLTRGMSSKMAANFIPAYTRLGTCRSWETCRPLSVVGLHVPCEQRIYFPELVGSSVFLSR